MTALEDLQARLDEAEEKIASLLAGCMKLDRDGLIQRITSIGPARWKAGIWLNERIDADRDERLAALRADPVAVLGLLGPEVRADIRACAEFVADEQAYRADADARLLDLLARSEPT